MSSVAYAPEEIFLILSVAGWRPTPHAVDRARGRRGDAHRGHLLPAERARLPLRRRRLRGRHGNLGPHAGLTVASALLVDYMLTVAVSISAAAANIGAPVPFVAEHKVLFAVGDRPAHRGEPARHPGVGRGLRRPGLRVHVRHRDDGRSGDSPAVAAARRRGAGRERRPSTCWPRATPSPAWRWCSWCCARSPGLRGADRRRGDQQRRAGVPQAQVAATPRRRCCCSA